MAPNVCEFIKIGIMIFFVILIVPKTKSGKIAELAVRDLIHDKEINNQTALANPECLSEFKDLKELNF